MEKISAKKKKESLRGSPIVYGDEKFKPSVCAMCMCHEQVIPGSADGLCEIHYQDHMQHLLEG